MDLLGQGISVYLPSTNDFLKLSGVMRDWGVLLWQCLLTLRKVTWRLSKRGGGGGQRPQSLQGQKEKGLSAREGVLVQLHSRKSDHYGMLAAWTCQALIVCKTVGIARLFHCLGFDFSLKDVVIGVKYHPSVLEWLADLLQDGLSGRTQFLH